MGKRPLEELVGVVGDEGVVENAEPLAVAGDFGPVPLDVLQVVGQVREAALEDLTVQGRVEHGLEVDKGLPRLLGLLQHKVRGALDGTHERAHALRVLRDELVVADVQDRAEAAAAQLGQLVDAQHLHVRLGPSLFLEPFFQLYHLYVLEADACVDLAALDGFGHVHPTSHCGIVRWRHAVVRGQLVDLDLAKLADIADAFALERAEVRGDAGRLEIHHAGEGFVEQAADGRDGEVAGFGLFSRRRSVSNEKR